MTHEVAKNALMESSDAKASILAAIARIESVPAGKTLIDEISDEDWCDKSVAEWNFSAGSEIETADELDECDKEIMHVA
ncbi:hypothetical protein SAMN04488117_10786 [Celeribacter baekdonensis]|uniref:Uncharacterized protein n=1 Tax=Celeribacter baekdonensis TaxID=875171 RepID=A0A1G7NVL9_9RHOB|nr:hypothetical protein [Celeribacter baekdonensis]SDF77260.1 hypothetical protein SAMN04488117_10786 [Celeribacter baekdonensis]